MRAKSRPISVRSAGEQVANPSYGLDEAGFLGIGLELGADLRDVDVDGAVESLRMALQRVEDLFPGEDAASGPGQGGQQLELVMGEHAPLARDRHLARGEVELELAHAEPCRRVRGHGATQEGANASEEFAGIEGLGEIV